MKKPTETVTAYARRMEEQHAEFGADHDLLMRCQCETARAFREAASDPRFAQVCPDTDDCKPCPREHKHATKCCTVHCTACQDECMEAEEKAEEELDA